MKKSIFILSIIIFFTFSNLYKVNGQISEGGKPPSFIYHLGDSLVDTRVIKRIDLKQVLHEDSMNPGPLWVGRSITVGLNMTNSGTWTNLSDGSRIWRLKLVSYGAKGISVCYDDFFIPEGGKLFLYNSLKTQVIGAFTYKNNPVRKLFSTEIIQGESVTLEYFDPKAISPNQLQPQATPSISISEIAYIYKSLSFFEQYSLNKYTQFGASLPCQVNVNCSEGSNWQDQKRGIAEILVKRGSDWSLCSGDLINTTNNSGIPYLLTADHCHSHNGSTASAADMLQWEFYFQFESSTCSNPVTAPAYKTLIGCVIKASSPVNGGSDFCLLLLNNAPLQTYTPYYNGWDRTNTAATSGVGIHHPEGDIKKISTFNSTLTTDTWEDGTNTGITDGGWAGSFVQTTHGYSQTEGGSSGSPLFNQNKLQVGILTGGEDANCTTGSTFLYGKFYYHWDKDGNLISQQLKPWLDPLGTNPNSVVGYDPYLPAPPKVNFLASPTSSCNGNIQFTDLSFGIPTSWNWNFGDGSYSNQKNPAHIYTSNGIFDVRLKVSNTYGFDSTIKKSYITINLPQAPITTNVSRCGTGSVNLLASGSGNLLWYDAQTGGNLVNTGTSFTTPNLTSDMTYYVQREIPQTIQSAGRTQKSSLGGYYYGTNYTSSWALIFYVLKPLKIISVMVYANSTANRTIWLKNSYGDVINSLVVNIPSGQQTVTLNFDVPVGTGYQLGTEGENDLWRDQDVAAYPYTIPNLISITGTNSQDPTYYYYFYNWQVQPQSCLSSRTPLTATINYNVPSVPTADTNIQTPTSILWKWNQVEGASGYKWNIADNYNTATDNGLKTNVLQTGLESDNTYTIYIWAYNSCGNSAVLTLTQNIISGVNNLNKGDYLNIYPNPATNELIIETSYSSLFNLNLINSIGQLIYNYRFNKKAVIDMSNLPKSMYLIKMSNNNETIVRKILKE